MLLKFVIEGQILKRTDKNIPVANSRGYLRAYVDLPEEYKGTITLNVKRQVDVIWTNTAYTIDRQTGLTNYLDDVLADTTGKNFNLYFWLSSTDTDIYIPTNEERMRIQASGDTLTALPGVDKSTNQYEETVEMYNEIKDLMQTAEEQAERINLQDKTTGINYKLGIENGSIYLEVV